MIRRRWCIRNDKVDLWLPCSLSIVSLKALIISSLVSSEIGSTRWAAYILPMLMKSR